MNSNLGIGSRVRHPEHGDGVIIQVKPENYLITFMTAGTREIVRTFEKLEVIDAYEPDSDLVSLADIEQIFTKLLQKFTDIDRKSTRLNSSHRT